MEFFPKILSFEESSALVTKLQAHFDQHGYGFWVLETREKKAFAGFVGLNHPNFNAHFMPCVEVGWRLAHKFWGQGIATEAAQAALKFAFRELKLNEVVSFTVPANRRSRAVMERLGMRHEPSDDFDHPQIPKGHPLRRHVLYRARPF